MKKANKIICALDLPNLKEICTLVRAIDYDITFKFGMEFFYNFGIEGIKKIKKIKPGIRIFLDLKMHDIPNTVSRSIKPLIKEIKPDMFTIHIAGGKKMMEETVKAADKASSESNIKKPLIIGVTILTSLGQNDIYDIDLRDKLEKHVINYSLLAKKSGLDGVVCSALETKKIKEICGEDFKTITPGIRILKSANDDQNRVVTPEEAFKNGSDYIVIGRNLIFSKEPNKIINQIVS
tara:strand:+ start:429 stop:1136 length:708 start_codon:yes stop_codon:yes gene_type:complete